MKKIAIITFNQAEGKIGDISQAIDNLITGAKLNQHDIIVFHYQEESLSPTLAGSRLLLEKLNTLNAKNASRFTRVGECDFSTLKGACSNWSHLGTTVYAKNSLVQQNDIRFSKKGYIKQAEKYYKAANFGGIVSQLTINDININLTSCHLPSHNRQQRKLQLQQLNTLKFGDMRSHWNYQNITENACDAVITSGDFNNRFNLTSQNKATSVLPGSALKDTVSKGSVSYLHKKIELNASSPLSIANEPDPSRVGETKGGAIDRHYSRIVNDRLSLFDAGTVHQVGGSDHAACVSTLIIPERSTENHSKTRLFIADMANRCNAGTSVFNTIYTTKNLDLLAQIYHYYRLINELDTKLTDRFECDHENSAMFSHLKDLITNLRTAGNQFIASNEMDALYYQSTSVINQLLKLNITNSHRNGNAFFKCAGETFRHIGIGETQTARLLKQAKISLRRLLDSSGKTHEAAILPLSIKADTQPLPNKSATPPPRLPNKATASPLFNSTQPQCKAESQPFYFTRPHSRL